MKMLRLKKQFAILGLAAIVFSACKKEQIENPVTGADAASDLGRRRPPKDTTTTTTTGTYFISTSGNNTTGNGSAGNPWQTLAKATSAVTAAGSIIHVNAGTYTETSQCNLAKGVSIAGDGISTTIVKSSVSGQWSTLLSLESAQDAVGNQSISNITFDGQYVSETNNKTWIGIWITRRSNVVIHDCKIINFRDRGVIFDGNGVQNPLSDPGHYATGNKFYNNTVLNSAQNNGQYGAGCLNIGGQTGMEIYGNTIIQDQRANFKNGWPIKYWENGWLKGVKIYNNTLKKAYNQGTYFGENGDWDFAIELFNINGLEIYGNAIQGSIDLNYNYKGAYAFSVWIHHNTLNHATQNVHFESGIILEFATQSALIEDNVINNSATGVQFNTRTASNSGGYTYPAPVGGYSALTDNVIRRNLFSNIYQPTGCCGGGAIMVVSENEINDPYIRNLAIYNNTIVGMPGNAPWVGIDFSSMTSNNANVNGVSVRNNIVTGFRDAWLKGSSPTHMTNVTITNNDAYGNSNGNMPGWPGGNPAGYLYNNNLSVNPLFTSATDFRLQSASPCINTGVNVGLTYIGTAPDIGYAEFGQ